MNQLTYHNRDGSLIGIVFNIGFQEVTHVIPNPVDRLGHDASFCLDSMFDSFLASRLSR